MKSATNKVAPTPVSEANNQAPPASLEKGAEQAPQAPPLPAALPPGPPPDQPDDPWREDPDYDPFAERVVRLPYS